MPTLVRLPLLLVLAVLTWTALQASETAQAATFSVKINFQPAGALIPAGYLADTGAAYGDRGNGYSYGWSGNTSAYAADRQNSLSPDQRYDTLNHMQWFGPFTWDIAVPNGTYSVRIVAGDPTYIDSTHRITAEGVMAVDGTPSNNKRWLEGTVVVSVSDGRLNIGNAAGSYNNKIAFIEITAVASGTSTTRVNFQPAAAPVPAGYLVDSGAPYALQANGQTYGWSGDTTPYTVDRNDPISPDQRYDTLNHMQYYGPFIWEIALPNGTYSVRVVAGDPWFFDSVYKITAEGILVVDGTPTSAARWLEGTVVIPVSDGRLTLGNASGAVNNKINFVEIASLDNPGNDPPAMPTITEPQVEGQIVHPADVHMETAPFLDADAGDTHSCTEWQIRLASTSEVVWTTPVTPSTCSTPLTHVHFGDGTFVNSHAGRTELFYDTNYVLRARHRDSSGETATQWSEWAQRNFRTATAPAPGTAVAWTLRQPGYAVEVFATGLELPVNIAFVPNPGPDPSDPYLYVTELYGNIKVVTRNGTVSDYIRGVLNYRPSGIFPGSGEQGMTGIAVDPISGDVFASMLYLAGDGKTYPKVVRFHSNHGGTVSGNQTTILDMAGEWQRESHQISNLSIGPDGKLYVHMGDGFEIATAQNLNSFRGKILRLNLDGSPATDNPFYNAIDGINARDYVFAYGFRNPFGGIWRGSDNTLYSVENGPSVDRLIKIVPGRNYLWDGTDTSMRNYAIYWWSPSVAPVNMAFIQPQTFNGSGFPAAKQGNAFVSESGPTYATGPQTNGKRISEFVLDAAGNWVSGPTPLLEYTGTGKATVAGLAAGPDGLYFTDLYKDLDALSPTDPGANILRIVAIDPTPPASPVVSSTSPGSGSNDNNPEVIGSAEAGSTVSLYTNSDCSSAVAATGSAAVFASPGITVTVGDNTTTTFYAKATDASDNASSCSLTSVAYQEITAPATTSTGFQSPSANSPTGSGDGNGFETGATNAYGDDGIFAVDTNSGTNSSSQCGNVGKDKHNFLNFGFSLPSDATVQGIEVRLNARVETAPGSPRMCVQLSQDGGRTWTAWKSTSPLGASEATFTPGGENDTWGRNWTVSNLSNANFRVRVSNVAGSTSRTFYLDWVAVNVYYTP